MRRPGWYIGLSWLIGCLIGACLSLNMLLMVTVGSILCLTVILVVPALRRRSEVWLSAIGVCGAMIALLVTTTTQYYPVTRQVGNTVTLRAEIYETSSGICGRVTGGDLPVGTRLQLWIGDEEQKPQLYDVLQGTFMLCDTGETGLSLLQTKASGVWIAAVPVQMETTAGKPPFTAWFRALRKQATDRISTYLTVDTAALTAGICFGDDQDLSAEAKGWFRVTGISHLFSVSGFHMAIIAQVLQWLLSRLRFPRWLRVIVAMGVVLFFMLTVGLEPSVVRSGVLCLLVLLSTCFRRQADTRNSLGLALLVLLVGDPFAAYDVGLLLSFTATFGLVLLFPRLKQATTRLLPKKRLPFVYRVTEKLISAVCLTVSASIATLPIMALFFGQVSVVAVLTNLLVSAPASALLILGCAASVCVGPVLSVFGEFLFLLCGWLARLLLWITEKISNFPLVTVAIRDTYLLLWIVGTGILIYAGWRTARKAGILRMVAICGVTLVIAVAGRTYLMKGVATLHVFPTEKDAAFCVEHNEQTVLFCTVQDVGTAYDLRMQLRLCGINEIDTVVVPAGNEAALTATMVLLKDYLAHARLLYGETAAPIVSFFDETMPLGKETQVLEQGLTLIPYDSFFSLMIGDTHVLVSTGGGSVWTVPASKRKADMILYGGALPSEGMVLTADKGIIQGHRQHLLNAAIYGVNQLTVADKHAIALMTRGTGDITETY